MNKLSWYNIEPIKIPDDVSDNQSNVVYIFLSQDGVAFSVDENFYQRWRGNIVSL